MLATVAVPIDEYRPLAFRHKWLMQVLVSFADRDGKCWPSLRTIAKHAGQSLSWVQENLAQMQSLGYFTRARRSGSYVYRIAVRFLAKWRGESTPADSCSVPADSGVRQRRTEDSPVKDKQEEGREDARARGAPVFVQTELLMPIRGGQRHGQRQSPVEKLFEGAARAADTWERRQRDRGTDSAADEPLLDRRRSASDT